MTTHNHNDTSHQQTLTRSGIRDAFYQKLDLPPNTASALLESILSHLTQMILTSPHVKIASFGTFVIHTKKERLGRNPKTKIEAVITPRKSVSFRPSTLLRQRVAAGPSSLTEV